MTAPTSFDAQPSTRFGAWFAFAGGALLPIAAAAQARR
jgi:hypothetical protein